MRPADRIHRNTLGRLVLLSGLLAVLALQAALAPPAAADFRIPLGPVWERTVRFYMQKHGMTRETA